MLLSVSTMTQITEARSGEDAYNGTTSWPCLLSALATSRSARDEAGVGGTTPTEVVRKCQNAARDAKET